MWSFENGEQASKVVMCSKSTGEGEFEEGCPMYMPGEAFYRATKIQAREVWNTRPPNDKGEPRL